MATWIDFKELREKLSFEDVLRHYGVEVKRKGDQHMGFCPLPSHAGKRKSPSFSANLARGIFHCFGCQAKGNVLEFAVLMENASLDDGSALRKVALDLQQRFCLDGNPRSRTGKRETATELPLEPTMPPAVVNMPIDFELKGLDRLHPYLIGRGFVAETIAQFGLGFCSRGSLAGRIAIPLHDSTGQLIGYAGRVVDDEAISDENPRYRFPSKRERDGAVHEFRKMRFLYNGHRFKSPREDLAVVEGFPSVWWLTQHGFPNVVATMGAECSDEQADQIVSLVKPKGHVWIIPDGDKAGEKFGQSLLLKLSHRRFVRWVKLGDGRQPTALSAREMKGWFSS